MTRETAKGVERALTIRGEVELRRCPFCTSPWVRAVRSMTESGDLADFTIECSTCSAAGPPGATLNEASKRWNLRL
jgi:hypothetical protein